MLFLTSINVICSDYGVAVIERVRNSTAYPIKVVTKKTIHDSLPSESIVRIKSKKPGYGESGRYFAVRQESGRYILKADTTDSTDPATELVVHHNLANDLTDWLAFSSMTANGQVLRALESQAVQFFEKGVSGEKNSNAHWKIHGSSLEDCYLENRLTKGFLGSRSKKDVRADIAEDRELREIDSEKTRLEAKEKRNIIRYGDKVQFLHQNTWQNIYGGRQRFKHQGSSENMIVFCPAEGEETVDTESSWWVVKGPHSDEDRFNCAVGTPVKNSDTVRFENVETGKNLHCAKKNPPPKKDGKVAEDKFHHEVSLFGNNGVGDVYDNWTISFHETGEKLIAGQLFSLNHVATGSLLFSDTTLFSPSGGAGEIIDEEAIWIVELTIKQKDDQEVRFRDRIRFRHMNSGRYLSAFEDNTISVSKNPSQDDVMWRVKGPHKAGERWNCKNEIIESGMQIRLESSLTQGNLKVDESEGDIKTYYVDESGLGDESDDWIIKTVGASNILKDGTKIVLRHVKSANEGSFLELAVKDGDVVSKSYKKVREKEKSEKLFQRVTAMKLETEETKKIREEIQKIDAEDQKKHAQMQKEAKEKADKLKGAAKQVALAAIENIKKPVNPRKKELESKLVKDDPKIKWLVENSIPAPMPVGNVAWTGFPHGSPSEQGPNEMIGIEVVKLGRGAGILPKRTVALKIDLLKKPPTFTGFATETILNFDVSYLLTLNPLLSKGVAWLEKSIKRPGRGSVVFLAKAQDKGDVQVLLGNDLTLNYVWKVIIGANNNTQAQIVRRNVQGREPVDEIVASVGKDENRFAACAPGRFVPYWVSFNDGEIILGGGNVIGESIILAWKDSNPRRKVSRVGFSTYKSAVKYAGVQIGDPVSIRPSSLVHAKDLQESLTASSAPTWLSKELRIPGRGCLEFDAKAGSDLMFVFADS
ncbi:hypothetical protein ACFLY6_00825, partial [Candidatus Dependentiae bacterium]